MPLVSATSMYMTVRNFHGKSNTKDANIDKAIRLIIDSKLVFSALCEPTHLLGLSCCLQRCGDGLVASKFIGRQ